MEIKVRYKKGKGYQVLLKKSVLGIPYWKVLEIVPSHHSAGVLRRAYLSGRKKVDG